MLSSVRIYNDPGALRERDPEIILRFVHPFERIGIPALILQLITGLLLAHRYVPGILPAFDFGDVIHQVITVKLILLLAKGIANAHARFWIIPGPQQNDFPFLAAHITLVTSIAVAMLVMGASIRVA